jgi:hypothetical protein
MPPNIAARPPQRMDSDEFIRISFLRFVYLLMTTLCGGLSREVEEGSPEGREFLPGLVEATLLAVLVG